MRRSMIFLTPVLIAASATPAFAGTSGVRLAAQTFVERVSTDVNGRELHVLTTPHNVVRGDKLVFIVRYRNEGHAPVDSFVVTNPVPSTLRIDPGDPSMLVSIDNGRNWGQLGTLSLPTALGGTRRATADDVTHVRWTVPQAIRPGDEGRISYRATVR